MKPGLLNPSSVQPTFYCAVAHLGDDVAPVGLHLEAVLLYGLVQGLRVQEYLRIK